MGTIKQEELLLRMVEALEGIHEELVSISININCIDNRLSECISHTERGDLLCITGNISTN